MSQLNPRSNPRSSTPIKCGNNLEQQLEISQRQYDELALQYEETKHEMEQMRLDFDALREENDKLREALQEKEYTQAILVKKLQIVTNTAYELYDRFKAFKVRLYTEEPGLKNLIN